MQSPDFAVRHYAQFAPSLLGVANCAIYSSCTLKSRSLPRQAQQCSAHKRGPLLMAHERAS